MYMQNKEEEEDKKKKTSEIKTESHGDCEYNKQQQHKKRHAIFPRIR